jgi:alpha-glucoside transport system permease protein
MVVALLVVPLQISLIPIMRDYMQLNLNGTFLAVWLAHTGFGLPLATYLMFTYISQLPKDIKVDSFLPTKASRWNGTRMKSPERLLKYSKALNENTCRTPKYGIRHSKDF